MLYAVLLLGLLPLALFPDGSDSEPVEESDDNIADDVPGGPDNLLDEIGGEPPVNPDDVLQPSDEIDVSDGDDEDPDDLLPPVDDDDVETPSDGGEGDILEPIDEDDVASPANTFEIEKPNGSNVADIEIFDVNSDVLCLFLDNDSETEVSTKASHDGKDTEVYLGNDLVCVLRGVSDATKVEINTALAAAA